MPDIEHKTIHWKVDCELIRKDLRQVRVRHERTERAFLPDIDVLSVVPGIDQRAALSLFLFVKGDIYA